jgi:glycosyltransferase involved in cell wall biosynthesis
VVIPAFREARTVAGVVSAVRAALPGCDVLVVDDGSDDATAQEARAAGAVVVRHPVNLGYGAALQTGYKYAVREGYAVVAQMDADGQHEPESLRNLIVPVERGETDVALGSRFLGELRYKLPLARLAGIWLFSMVVRAVTGWRVTDPTSGFQAFTGRAATFLASDVFPSDYADADVLILLKRAGFRLLEVPVTMLPSQQGRSMHRGLRPFYYVFRMLLAVCVEMLRKVPHGGGHFA